MAQLIPEAVDPWIGRTIAGGKYELLTLVGSGAMGKVYAGRHLALDREVAVKVLHGSYQTDQKMVARFNREAQAASRIRHPNVVHVMDFGQDDDGSLYIVMENLSGMQLDELVLMDAATSFERVVAIMSQICNGVAAAHDAGVIHRDLKPDNVIVVPGRGEDDATSTDVVKLLDFGIAKIQDRDSSGRIMTVELPAGTPEFMSPEQCRGESIDHRTDIYSCGCLLYYLATGVLPFTAQNALGVIMKQVNEYPQPPSSLRSDLPPAIDQVVARALEKDRTKRYQDVRALSADLMKLARPEGAPVPVAFPTSATEPVEFDTEESTLVTPSYGHRKGFRLTLGLILIASAGATAGILWPTEGSDEEATTSASSGISSMAAPSREVPPEAEAANPRRDRGAAVPSPAPRLAVRTTRGRTNRGRKVARPAPSAPSRSAKARARSRRRARQRATARARERQAASGPASPQPPPTSEAPAAPERLAATEPGTPAAGSSVAPPETPTSAGTPEPAAPAPARTKPAPAAPRRLPLRARVTLTGLDVDGSLPTSDVRRAVERRMSDFSACYRNAARAAGRNSFGRVQVTLQIDESGRVRGSRARGARLPGMDGCVSGAARRVVPRRRPDVGTVTATFALMYRAVEDNR